MRAALGEGELAGPADLANSVPLGAFGDYDLLEELGHGGMGVVYQARQRSLQRVVALKMLLGGQFAGKVALGRFRAEAELAAQLQHPNIVAIHEIGEQDGLPYFTMDFVAGRNLVDLVRDHPLSAPAAATYVQIIARAIHYAHEQGVLHRDLKPSNILIDAFDQPRITDFGLAKRLTGSTSDLTVSGQALGSPNFMPPEQAAGKHKTSGPTNDIYGLGAILYYLITGRPPFVAENASATVRQVLENEPVSPRVLNPSVPRDLETLCLKCLQKEPTQRYASAQAVADELGRFLRGEPIRARRVGIAAHLWRWCCRKPQVAGLLLAVFVLGLTGFLSVLTQWQRAERLVIQEARQRTLAEKNVQQLRLHQATEYLANGRAAEGVALLASQLRLSPGNRALAEWVATELTYRNFPLPLAPAMGHEKECTSAEFSPDGQFIHSVARDNAARVWVAATGQPSSAPMRHDPSVVTGDLVSTSSKPLTACFSRDGKLVATASVDGTARIWEAHTGTPRTPPLSHPDWVSSARFSPDGRLVATACRDGVIRLWDVAQGTLTGPVFRHAKWVNTVEFSPDGERLLTAADDGVAQVWETRTGAAVGKPLQHAKVVKMAAFSSDGQKVVTASEDGTARIWQAATGDPIGDPLTHSGRINFATFSPDGRWIATASADRTARLWDASTGSPASDALRHSGDVRWVEFSPEGQRLVTASEDRTARVWSVATGEPVLEPIHHRGTVWTARFSPEGRRLVTASADGTAQIWDALPGAIAEMTLPTMSRGLKTWWSPDGGRLLTVTRSARIWNARTGYSLAPGFPEADARDARFSPSGKLVAVASGSGNARVWDSHTFQAVSPLMRHTGAVNSIEFNPDESRVVTASDDGTARLWDARHGRLLVPPLRHPAAVRHATFSPDGRSLATAGDDPEARLWDAATGRLLLPPLRHSAEVRVVRFNPNGLRLLTVSADSAVHVWNVANGRRCGPALQHEGPVRQAIFAPDSRHVLTASQDWTVRIWDPDSGKLATPPLHHEGVVTALDLRADGRSLVTATRGGRLELWHDYREYAFSSSLPIAVSLVDVVYSPDGFSLATAGSEQVARVFRLPQLGDSVPEWFAPLAEAMVGRVVSSEGELGFVKPEALFELRGHVNALSPADRTHHLAQWWLADKVTRPVAPVDGLDLESHISRLILATGPAGSFYLGKLRRAMCRAPHHGGLHAYYARTLLETGAASAPPVLQEAEWHSARAIRLSPNNFGVWLTQAALSERAGKTNDAISATEKAAELSGGQPDVLLAAATLQERAGHPAAADDNYRRAVAAAFARKVWDDGNRRGIIRQHAEFLARQGRLAEAHVEHLRSLGVPPRAPDTPERLVNLDAFYNRGLNDGLDRPDGGWLNLAALPKGRQTLGDVEFDIRGIVQLDLAWQPDVSAPLNAPSRRADAVPIRRICRRLHFLHAAGGEAAAGTVVAAYKVHLPAGGIAELPLVYGRDVLAFADETGPAPAAARVAWQGRSPGTTRLRLFHTIWENPRPEQEVVSIDFVSKLSPTAAPFLVAVTVE